MGLGGVEAQLTVDVGGLHVHGPLAAGDGHPSSAQTSSSACPGVCGGLM